MPPDRPLHRRLAAPALAAGLFALAGCDDAEPTAPPALVGSLDADFEGGSLAGWTWSADEEFDLVLATAPGGLHHYFAFRLLDRAGLPTDFRVLNAQSATHHDVVHGPRAGRFMGPTEWQSLGVTLGETLSGTLEPMGPGAAADGG